MRAAWQDFPVAFKFVPPPFPRSSAHARFRAVQAFLSVRKSSGREGPQPPKGSLGPVHFPTE